MQTYLLIQDRGARATTGWDGNISFFEGVIAFIAITIFFYILTWIGAQFEEISERKKEKELMIKRSNWEKKIEQKWKTKRNLQKYNEQFELENDFKPSNFIIDMDEIDTEWQTKKETIFKLERDKLISEYRKNRTPKN